VEPLIGPTIPDWGGAQAGMSGKVFAKILRDVASDTAPVVSYWKQALIDSDSRIPAKAVDRSSYLFPTPSYIDVLTVTAELRFRRAPQAVMDAKGWDTSDIVMERVQVAVPVLKQWHVYLPLAVHGVID
jgi:hypothetical protein